MSEATRKPNNMSVGLLVNQVSPTTQQVPTQLSPYKLEQRSSPSFKFGDLHGALPLLMDLQRAIDKEKHSNLDDEDNEPPEMILKGPDIG